MNLCYKPVIASLRCVRTKETTRMDAVEATLEPDSETEGIALVLNRKADIQYKIHNWMYNRIVIYCLYIRLLLKKEINRIFVYLNYWTNRTRLQKCWNIIAVNKARVLELLAYDLALKLNKAKDLISIVMSIEGS